MPKVMSDGMCVCVVEFLCGLAADGSRWALLRKGVFGNAKVSLASGSEQP
jgi:hypothetical protein